MPRLILTDRDRETLHRLAAEWRSEPGPEDRGARTREAIIGLVGGDSGHLDRYAAYLLLLSLLELLSPAHLPPRAGPVVLRALESLADGEGGREYVKIMDDMRALPGATTLSDSPLLSLPPGMGSPGAGDARTEPGPEAAGESAIHGPAPRAEHDAGSGSRGPAPWFGEAGAGDGREPAPRPGIAGDARTEPGPEAAGESAIHGPAPRAEHDAGSGSRGPAPWSGEAGAGDRREPAPRPGIAGDGGSRDPTLRPAAVTERILREATAGEPPPAHRAARSSGAETGASDGREPAPRPGIAGDGGSRDPALRPAAVTERILRGATTGEPSPAHRAAGSSGAEGTADPDGGDASAAWDAPPPGTPDPGAAGHAVANLPGVDIEALARRITQFAGNGARDGTRPRAPGGQDPPTAGSTSGGGIVRDGPRPIGGPTGGGARSRAPLAGKTPGDDARDRAPATPSLESVLLLESAGERFALRAADVTGVLGPGVHDAARTDGGPPGFVHHGESYHFVDLARALALGDTGNADESGPARVVVLLRRGGRRVALLCGGVDEREELPVHPLPPVVPREALATAAVIAGDGRPLLLLDTAALAQYAGG